MSQESDKQSQSGLTSFIVNVLLPVFILSYMSEGGYNILDRAPGRDIWDLGPVYSMVAALMLPFFYGLYALIKQRRFELMSAVGLVSVVLTGTVSFFVIAPDGTLNSSAPWLFGIKEALIPLSLSLSILLSHRTNSPLLKTFIYTPELFNIKRIERAIEDNRQQSGYDSLLWCSTLILTGALFVSSLGNFFLALHFLDPILLHPGKIQHLEYNLAVGKITWWGFLIIGVPMVAALMWIIVRLVNQLKKLTGLEQDDIMARR